MSGAWGALAVAAARVGPLALVAPLGPPTVRVLVGGALSMAVAVAGAASPWPPVSARSMGAPSAPLGLLLSEGAVGLVLGLAAAALVLAGRTAGAAVDALRPGERSDRGGEGAFGQAFGWLALALFAGIGGPGLLVDAVGRSYQVLPVGRWPTGGPAAVVEVGARIMALAVELAGPLLGAWLLAQLVLALVRRAAPSLAGAGGGTAAPAAELLAALAVLAGAAGLVAALSGAGLAVGDTIVQTASALAR